LYRSFRAPFSRAVLFVLGALALAPGAHAQAPATPSAAPATPAAAPTPEITFPGQWAPPPADWKYPVWPNGCNRFDGPDKTACLEFIAFDFGRLSRYAQANKDLGAPKPGQARVVFFGDSITDGWSRPAAGGFFKGKPYVNRGIGGQTTSQMLLRYRDDVIDLAPKAVVILAGTNDLAGNSGPVGHETIQENWATMAELAKLHGIRVVLASILPVSDDKKDASGSPLVRSRNKSPEILRGMNRWLSDYAKANGHVYLDYYSAMADAAGSFLPNLNDDGLHPNANGYAVMAPLAEKALQEALR